LATAASPLVARVAFFREPDKNRKIGFTRRCAKALPLGSKKIFSFEFFFESG